MAYKAARWPGVLLLCAGWILLCACRPENGPAEETITVFAAASLTDAFSELGRSFEAAHTQYQVRFNFAGSQQLAQQLAQGAPADVFASADERQMAVAIESGRVRRDAAQPFAHNELVVVTPAANPAGIDVLQDLAQPGVTLVLAAPLVPAGQYALEVLRRASPTFRDEVLANVVSYEQNVRAVLTKVALGEADAGIVYASDVGGAGAAGVHVIQIPPDVNSRATYPIAVVDDSRQPAPARAFVAFVLSPAGQERLAAYGFIPVSTPPSE